MIGNDAQDKQLNVQQPNQKPIDADGRDDSDRLPKLKFILDLILVLLVAASFWVSIKSCQTSEDAKRISKDALNLSKKQFFQINRPHLIFTPVVFRENNKYFKFEHHQDTFKIFLKYKIENVGNVAAMNIITPEEADWYQNGKLKGAIPLEEKTPGPISLAPEEEIIIVIYVRGKPTGTANIEAIIKDYNAGTRCITHEFPLLYHNELDTSITYSLTEEHELCADDTSILQKQRNTTQIYREG